MDNILKLHSPGGEYKINLPNIYVDHIQKVIAATKEPYEKELLLDMAPRLKPGDLFLDIGGNIGNHSLFIASLKCNVFYFEPTIKLINMCACEGALS
ncbi:MAG: hypothetical protein LBJ61_09190, partial [Deltaproteobacteria bacterium]|nr:hypothetical protein [Deltaproteobacteria bacterium]